MPRVPDKESGKGFFVRRKTSKANEEIKEETEDEEDVEEGKCVASASAEVEEKVRNMDMVMPSEFFITFSRGESQGSLLYHQAVMMMLRLTYNLADVTPF